MNDSVWYKLGRVQRIISVVLISLLFVIALGHFYEGVAVASHDITYRWRTEGPFAWKYFSRATYAISAFMGGACYALAGGLAAYSLRQQERGKAIFLICLSVLSVLVVLFAWHRPIVEWVVFTLQ